ncbi:MAG TPA: crystallin J1, partial [Actinobacteria bacterium]|nr:crystallin J1 [Actinomycetota bacterium]
MRLVDTIRFMTLSPGERMLGSLAGLSVGDAFGQRFFYQAIVDEYLESESLPPGPWSWTDDTLMALSIVVTLLESATVDQDALALSFGKRFEGTRGYGQAMHRLLALYAIGADWRFEAPQLFGGQGSFGNGAAMRIAPLGAFFADDLDRVVVEAERAAEVTHAHPEAIAGAIAVAVAAGAAATGELSDPTRFVEAVLERTPDSEVRDRLERIERITPTSSLSYAVTLLGNGSRITAQDTVAFCIWVASQHLGDYRAAMWQT